MDKLKTVILLAVISFGVAHSSHPLLEDGIDSSKKWIISQLSITQGKIDSCFKQVKRYNFLIKEARTNLEFLEEFKLESIVSSTKSVIASVLSFKPEKITEIKETMTTSELQLKLNHKNKELESCKSSFNQVKLSYNEIKIKISEVVDQKKTVIDEFSYKKQVELEECTSITESNKIIIDKIISGETKYKDAQAQLNDLLKTLEEDDEKFKEYTAQLLEKIDKLISEGTQDNSNRASMMVVDISTPESKKKFYDTVRNSVSNSPFTPKTTCDALTRQGVIDTFKFEN